MTPWYPFIKVPTPTPPPICWGGGIYCNHFVHLSVCPFIHLSICSSVHVSDGVHAVSPELPNYFFKTKFGMMVYYHEAMCLVEKLVHHPQISRSQRGLI